MADERNLPIFRAPLIALVCAVTGGTLLFDLAQPLGVAAGVPYVALVLIGLSMRDQRAVFGLAGLATSLTLLGFFMSPSPGGGSASPFLVPLINRLLTLCAIWALAATSIKSLGHEERAARRLRMLAETDPLTGVANRRRILQVLERQRQRGASTTLMILDVDHFKRLNDTAGHLVGDQVLRSLCRRIESVLGGEGMLGRIGGEEFLVLLPGGDRSRAQAKAEAIRRAAPLCSTRHPVTLSAGVAILRPEASASQGLRLADGALYAAKRGGRNRVEFAALPSGVVELSAEAVLASGA